tara:strand:+ start:207 stop:788 length:582 start_codon:yes stop_codon:yes gene_type:complete
MTLKTCTQCKEQKTSDCFQKDNQTPDALCVYCRVCRAARLANVTAHKKARRNSQMREWRQARPEEVKAKKAASYKANKDEVKAKVAAYRDANKEKIKIANRLRYLETKDAMRPKRAQIAAAKRQRQPKWLSNGDKKIMIAIYEESARLTKTTRIRHEVDHIVPLLGKLVSGLHVPANLQIITMKANRSKGNRF